MRRGFSNEESNNALVPAFNPCLSSAVVLYYSDLGSFM
jgi:hypothetical protein